MANVDDVLTRGVEHVYPSVPEFKAALLSGKKLKIYFGIDPTGPTLHIGHVSNLIKLREFVELGHQVTILLGDFTAMIGDPDKKEARKKLTPKEIQINLKGYKKQIGNIIPLNKIKIAYNSKWHKKLTFADVLELASEFTVSQMLERDMFSLRFKAGEPVYIHEFFYPIMQGYDSVAMGVDVEVGGNDQTFNMLAGRTMMKRRGKEKFVISNKLLVDPTGKKMGKTEGNMVMLTDTANDIYGKVMSWPDTLMPLAYEICTRVDRDSYDALIVSDPKKAKMQLAREITALVHGVKKAVEAEENWVATFSQGGVPEEIDEIKAEAGDLLVDVLLKKEVVKSKGEWRRLVDEGAARAEDDIKITDYNYQITKTQIFKIGKKRFIKVIV